MPADDQDPVYSIGISNRFATINSDEISDPQELILAAQELRKEKEPKVKGKKDVKPVKQTDKKFVKIETSAENESDNRHGDRPRSDRPRGRGRGGRGGRGGERGRGSRGGSRGGFSPNHEGGFGFNNNNQPRGDGFGKSPVTEVGEGGFGGDSEERRGGRSGYRGRGGRGGGRGRGGGGRGGSREFDRRSGSDKSSVKAFDKRDGSGSYNWGTPQDDINAASEDHARGFGTPKEGEEVPAETTEQIPQETEEIQVEEEKDEGPQEITFEEYKKNLAESRKKKDFNVRKVESVDKKTMKQLKKPTEEESMSAGSLFYPTKHVHETFKSSGRVKENLPCDLNYSCGENRHMDSSRRGGRGGRGGRRGGKRDDFNNSKGGKKNEGKTEIALGNDEEFPSLG